MNLKEKYGNTALVAGASEGLGAAFARYLAAQGMDVVLIGRRKDPLEKLAAELQNKYKVNTTCISCDLADVNAAIKIKEALNGKVIGLLMYNAGLSYIGPFEKNSMENHNYIAQVNMITPMNMINIFSEAMLKNKRGAIILMASLAGFQGSGFLTVYAATKAFDRTLAESLWYEWKERGVDVIACCAGATSTQNFLDTKPGDAGIFAPRVQTPEEVVDECFECLGKTPSFIAGSGNKIASFFMQKLLPRKMAVTIMGDTTKKIYSHYIQPNKGKE